MAADVYWDNVVLAMHMDGANNSTKFTDLKGHVFTPAGNAKISTTASKFGGASAYFDQSTDKITTPSTADWHFGTGDFTIEAWINPTALSAWNTIMATDLGGSTHWYFRLNISSGLLTFRATNDAGGVVTDLTSATAVAITTWSHVAAVRNAGTVKLYINGVSAGATGTNLTTTYHATALALTIGHQYGTVNPFYGYIDDVRITKGVARYTANFTAPTAAFDEGPYGAITMDVTAPSPTVSAVYGGANAAFTAPSPTLSSYGGASASATVPSPTLQFTAHNSYGDNAAFVKPPKITVSAYGGGRAALTAPSPNLTSTATGTALAVANLTAPSPTVEALGTVSNVANISITIPGPNVLAYAGSVCSVTIAGVTVQATGTGGGVAHAAITIPLFQLDAQGTAQNHGGANISAPMPVISTGGVARLTIPMATLTVIGTATVVATYEAYALNLKHTAETNDEVTHYTNFPFTHIVRYKDRYYGANTTGLYLLDGTTDDGAAIEWAFKTGMTDFDSPQLKTVTYAYFGGRMGPDATVTIYPSEPTGQSYAYTTPRGQTAQNYRQQFGKGLKARYYAIGASGADALELDSLDLTVATLTRRI